MLIRTIELRNEKEAPYRKLKLSGGFNIISGMNGEGKTYLLETIASGLQVLADNFALSGELFIKKDAKTDSAEILNSTDGSDRPTVGRIIRCVMEIDGSGKCFQLKRIVNESGEEDTVIEDPGLADIIGRSSGKDLPIFSFYRLSIFMEFDWDSTEHSSMITKEKRNSAYHNWSDAGNNDSCERTLSWIRETASLRNELELREGDSSRNIHQSDERRVLNRMLNAAFPEILDVCWDPEIGSILISREIKLIGGGSGISQIPMTMLSDGERSVILLFADILRRMCVLNPQLRPDEAVMTEGIILIDEPEAHLHPDWQRKMLKGLRTAFPKIQFIAASNSPVMLGEVDPANVNLLVNGKVLRPVQSYGLNVSEIMENILNVPSQSPEVMDVVDVIKEYADSGNANAARRRLNVLEDQLNGSTRVTRDAEAVIALHAIFE